MTVFYEDSHLIVCLKPVGVQSENGTASLQGMPELLRAFWGDTNAPVFPVHRLDAAVSGIMVYAKTKQAAAALSAQMQDKHFKKEYYAVVIGAMENKVDTLEDILYHDKRKGKVFPVKKERKGAKVAILRYETIKTRALPEAFISNPPPPAQEISLLHIHLDTGRTHQIRVQFASRKHPLLGDGKYGSRVKLPSLALFSARLSFEHPKTHEHLSFAAPTPSTAPWIFFNP